MKKTVLFAMFAAVLMLAACDNNDTKTVAVGSDNEAATEGEETGADQAAETVASDAAAEAPKIAVSEEFTAAKNEFHQTVAVIHHQGYEAEDVSVIKDNAQAAVDGASNLVLVANASGNEALQLKVNLVLERAEALNAAVNSEKSDEEILEAANLFHEAFHDLKESIE